MTNRASSTQNITWSSYNYPVAISASDSTGSEEVQFTYGPDRQRWEQIYTGPSGTEKTYYVGGLMDIVFNGTTDYRQYIYAGAEPVAIYSRTSASGVTMRYLLEDHQGGISAITANSGVSDMGESFTAFGQRRSRATWTGPPSTSDLNTIAGISRQGYNFQTWLGQSMGLNHMNGRVQDAVLGRFLSPDSHIPDPTNPQSYNRYSYALNNPLTRIDPSGFEDETVPADGGAFSPGPIDPGPMPTVNIPDISAPNASTTSTGSMIPGHQTGNFLCGGCVGSSGSGIGGTTGAGGVTGTGGTTTDGGAADSGTTTQSGGSAQSPSSSVPTQSPQQSQDPLSPIVVTAQYLPSPDQLAEITVTAGPSYLDRYVNFVSSNAINVGPYAAALFGGLWPKSWAPATNFRPPLLGSSNPLTSVPRAFGVSGADSALVQTGAAGIGLVTVGVGFYDLTIELEGFLYAIPSQ